MNSEEYYLNQIIKLLYVEFYNNVNVIMTEEEYMDKFNLFYNKPPSLKIISKHLNARDYIDINCLIKFVKYTKEKDISIFNEIIKYINEIIDNGTVYKDRCLRGYYYTCNYSPRFTICKNNIRFKMFISKPKSNIFSINYEKALSYYVDVDDRYNFYYLTQSINKISSSVIESLFKDIKKELEK
jgi:hypothetical protein